MVPCEAKLRNNSCKSTVVMLELRDTNGLKVSRMASRKQFIAYLTPHGPETMHHKAPTLHTAEV